MGCPNCKSNQYSQTLFIKDYEYNIHSYEKYLNCSSCKLIYRERSIKENEEKILYSKNNYKPVKGGIAYDFLKKINAYYEKKVIFKYIFNGKPNKKKIFLDIACGKGYLLKLLQKNTNINCFGIDINTPIKPDNVKYIQSNYNNLDVIKNINADLILINNFIEHVDELKYIFDIVNSLKKDGILIIITPDSNSKARMFFQNCWSGYHAPRHKMIFNISNINQAFNRCESIDIESYKMNDPFTNLISFINLYKELKNNFSLLIFLKLIISPIFIFANLMNRNRIIMIIKKK